MKNKEKNFISAVVYIRNAEGYVESFLDMLYHTLTSDFERFEIICVNDCSTDNSVGEIKKFARSMEYPVISIIHMSYYQGLEISMNAGIDLAIGDFVYEFDQIMFDYEKDIIIKIYNESLKGYDIVSASPDRAMQFTSKCFYKIFNKYSNNFNQLETERFRILSRRGINRVHAMSKTIPYRKAVYASCGLKTACVKYDIVKEISMKKENDFRWNTAIDSLILFTDIGYKISLILTFIMMLATMISIIYTAYVFLNATPIAGWTTTMLVMSFSFFGIFAVSAIIIKYLSLLISLTFQKQKYVIEGIEKITK